MTRRWVGLVVHVSVAHLCDYLMTFASVAVEQTGSTAHLGGNFSDD